MPFWEGQFGLGVTEQKLKAESSRLKVKNSPRRALRKIKKNLCDLGVLCGE